MKVQGTDLSLIRGDTETIIISCSDINSQPLQFVNGDILYFTVKEKTTTEDKLIQKVITNFETDGTALIDIDSADTKDLRFKTYVYDIQWVRTNGVVTTIVPPSKFTILEEVTYEWRN